MHVYKEGCSGRFDEYLYIHKDVHIGRNKEYKNNKRRFKTNLKNSTTSLKVFESKKKIKKHWHRKNNKIYFNHSTAWVNMQLYKKNYYV